MMDKDIDEISRSAFPDGDVAFDAKYWNQMGAMIDQRKKKRGFIFWWGKGGALILLIGGLLAYASLNNNASRLDKTEEKTATLSGTSILTSETKKLSDSNLEQIESSIALNSNLIDVNTSSNTENNSEVTAAPTETNVKTVLANQKQIAPENKIAPVPVTLDYSNSAKSINGNIEVSKDQNTTSVSEKVVSGTAQRSVGRKPENNSDRTVMAAGQMQNKAENNTANIVAEPSLVNKNLEIDAINPLKSGLIPLGFNRFDLYKMPIDSSFKKDLTEFNEAVESGSKLRYFLEPVVGFNSSYRTVNAESQIDNSTFNLDYKPTQEVQLGLNLGAKYGNFFGALGLHFNHIQSTIDVSETELATQTAQSIAERTIVDQIDSVLIKTPVIKVPSGSDFVFQKGAPQYNIDTTLITVYDTTTTTSNVEKATNSELSYRLQYVCLPMQTGYEFPIKSFFIGAGLGFDLGFLINSKGKLFDPELSQIVTVTSSDLVNKTTLAYNLQFAFGYHIKPNLSIAIRPNLRQQVISPFKNTNLPNTRLGGFVGLRYDF